MDRNAIAETLAAIRKAQQSPIVDPRLAKASTFAQSGTATSGLTYYDLETGAKLLYPVLTPLRNIIPRVGGGGGIQAAWRAITGINTSGLRVGVSGGNRGGVQAVTTADYVAAYRGIGLETNVDFEAEYAADKFEDVRATAAMSGLQALMLQEESIILGGNNSLALGTTATPTLVQHVTGGGLSDGAQFVKVVGLTLDGYLNGSLAGGVQGQITRTNADGSSDTFGGGTAHISAEATITLNGGGALQSLTANVAPQNGAVAYAWYWGATGAEVLGAITTVPTVLITAAPTGTQTAASLGVVDSSQNALVFDGLLTQAFKPGSNAYVAQVAGTLTGDGAGGVVQIDTALKSMWDNYRLSPDTIWVSSQEALGISKLILAGTATAAQRFVFNTDRDSLGGGIMVRTYLNRFSMAGGSVLDIKIHPNMPAGTALMTSRTIPYPLSGVGNVVQVKTRREYYQIEWPLRSRKYEYGVYADQVLQHYFPPSMAVLTGIVGS